jgi:NADH-quinone oxidoreductase subunit E
MLSDAERRAVEAEMARYPDKRAACIDALIHVQETRGWISDQTIDDLAPLLGMNADELEGVATFYNRILRRPVGRHLIWICDSASCWIMGSDTMRKTIEQHLGITLGETTPDCRFTLLPTVCLGACDRAPALMVDDELHLDVVPARIADILARYE